MFREIKESIANSLICWLMKHTHCHAGVFYTACHQYYPGEVKTMYESWLNYMKTEGKMKE